MDATYIMTNKELADAISCAFDGSSKTLVGGYGGTNNDATKAMLEHLKSLLECQAKRANMVRVSGQGCQIDD